jgi:O-antigen/teichoic acid export membrane protein
MATALVARLAPLFGRDGSKAGQRGQQRYVRAALTAASSILNKGVSALALLISVPLTVGYLGVERYGVWLALSSLIAIIAYVDLGLSSGLVNAISAADGDKDHAAAARSVASVFLMLAGLACALSAAFFALYPWLPLSYFIRVTSPTAASEIGPALCALIICFLLNMPLGVGQRIQIGYQEGYKASLWQSAGTVLGLLTLIAFIRAKASLPWLVLATSAPPLLTSAANCVYQFYFARPWLLPKRSNFHWPTAQRILRTGLLFCVAGLATVLITQIPYVMINRTLGPAAVAQYGVAQKLWSLSPVLVSMTIFPLWPAYREALASGDLNWIARTFRMTLIAVLATSLGGALLLLATYRKLISTWVNPGVVPDASIALALSVFVVASSLKWTTWMCLNGYNRLRGQAAYPYPIIFVASISAAMAGRRYGMGGIIWPFALAECCILAIQMLDLSMVMRTKRTGSALPHDELTANQT